MAELDIYMQFARVSVVESAAATITRGEILTGLDIRGGILWLLHMVEVRSRDLLPDIPTTGAEEMIEFVLSIDDTLTSIPRIDSRQTIFYYKEVIKGGVATYVPLVIFRDPATVYFNPPLPYAHPKINAYILSNASAARRMDCRVGYTTVKAKATDFIEVVETWRQ